MEISKFAHLVNESLPSIEQIKAKLLKLHLPADEFKAKETRNSLFFSYNLSIGSDFNKEPLYQFIEHTNIRQVSIGGINFYESVKMSSSIENGLEFAKHNDFYKIALNLDDSTIVWYNDESKDFEVIARGLDQFLSFLIECRKYEMNVLYGVGYSKDEMMEDLRMLIRQGLNEGFVREFIL